MLAPGDELEEEAEEAVDAAPPPPLRLSMDGVGEDVDEASGGLTIAHGEYDSSRSTCSSVRPSRGHKPEGGKRKRG
jgi:hypothetical protein